MSVADGRRKLYGRQGWALEVLRRPLIASLSPQEPHEVLRDLIEALEDLPKLKDLEGPSRPYKVFDELYNAVETLSNALEGPRGLLKGLVEPFRATLGPRNIQGWFFIGLMKTIQVVLKRLIKGL